MKRKTKGVSALAAALVFCVLTATIVLAATNSSFQNLLARLTPVYKDYITPVEQSCIDQGIKMEVVAIGAYNNQVKAYITLQDLEENRLNETSRFFIDVQANGAGLGGGAGDIDFDKEAGVLTYLIQSNSGSVIESETATIGIYMVQSNPKAYEGEDYNIDLIQANRNPETVQISLNDIISIGSNQFGFEKEGTVKRVLKPNNMNITFPEIDYLKITNMGIVDGMLHVQTWQNPRDNNHGNLELVDGNGNKIHETTSLGFSVNNQGEIINRQEQEENSPWNGYTEYIYEIDINDLDKYTLVGEFTVWEEIAGNWQVTAEIDTKKDVIEINEQMEVDGLGIDKITITPFGATFSGSKFTYDAQKFDVQVHDREGSLQLKWHGGYMIYDTGEYETILFDSSKPIDTKSLNSISINGKTVSFKK